MKKKILSIILALTVAISMMPLSAAIVSADTAIPWTADNFIQVSKVYTGYAPFFTYDSKDVENPVSLTQGTDFKVTVDTVNAGKQKVTIVGLGAYKSYASIKKTVTISKLNFSKISDYYEQGIYASPAIAQAVYNNGKAVKPKVTGVIYSNLNKTKKLKLGKDFKVKYYNNKKIGNKAYIKITGIGKNCTGTGKVFFSICPKAPVISKMTAGKGKLTIKMKTTPSKLKGTYYAVTYYPTDKQLSYDSAPSITCSKKSTITLKGLEKGKKYNVCVWVVYTKSKKMNFMEDLQTNRCPTNYSGYKVTKKIK